MLIGLAVSRVNIGFCIMNDQVTLLHGVWQCQASQLAVTEWNRLKSIQLKLCWWYPGNESWSEMEHGIQVCCNLRPLSFLHYGPIRRADYLSLAAQ
jgi:hypothetical protein